MAGPDETSERLQVLIELIRAIHVPERRLTCHRGGRIRRQHIQHWLCSRRHDDRLLCGFSWA